MTPKSGRAGRGAHQGMSALLYDLWGLCQYRFRAPEAGNGTLAVTEGTGFSVLVDVFPFPAGNGFLSPWI